MSDITRKIKDHLREIEQLAAKEISSKQTSQSFSGRVKVHPDKVFIGERDGRRAIEFLRKNSR